MEERRQPRTPKWIHTPSKIAIIIGVVVAIILIGTGIGLAFTLSRTVNVTVVEGMTVAPSPAQSITVYKNTSEDITYTVTNTADVAYNVTVSNTTLSPGVSVVYDKTYFPLAAGGSTTVTATISADATASSCSFDIMFANDMT